MPNWRKLIQSGSDAELASLFIFKSGSTDDRLLVVSGANGEMMAVSDDNSGTLLRVNDVSGINMFSVSSSGHLVAPQLTFDDDAPFTLGYESGSGLVTYRSASNALSASYATTASHAIFSLSSIDSQDLIVGVKNDFGATIQKGTPVYAKGVLGENILVAPASASDSTKMPAIAVLNETLTNNSAGDALISGRIKNVNTLGFTAGETVYVGPNGGYTQVKPTGSALIQNLGIVGKVNETEGEGVVIGAGRSNDVPNLLPDYIFLGSSGNTLRVPFADAITGSLPSGVVSGSAQTVANLVNQDVDLGSGDLTATEATVNNFTINNTLTAPTITGSLLRLSENGTGLRLTNVGAFESSSGFHIFANDNLRFSTNGSGGGNEALNIAKTSKKATFTGDVVTTALTASGLNYPTTDGSADQVLSTDGNGNLSFNDISDLSVPSFLVFGQEGTLTGQTTAFEMKTTNGAQATGWRMPVGGSVTHITLQLEVKSGGSAGRNITAELYKNNTATGKSITVACSSDGITGGNGTITTETFSAGDRLTLYIQHNNASLATGDHAGLVRILTSTA